MIITNKESENRAMSCILSMRESKIMAFSTSYALKETLNDYNESFIEIKPDN